MSRTNAKIDARRRARDRKAILDAQRAERDEQVESATVDYFEAIGTIEELQAQLEDAHQAADRAVLRLFDLDQKIDQVATLTDLEVKDVRRIKRSAPAGGSTAHPATDQAEQSHVDEAASSGSQSHDE